MIAYLLKRLLMTVIVLFTVVVFLSLLVHIVPGDPARTILGPRAQPETIEKIRSEMDLDKPVPFQVVNFIGNLLRGSLGTNVFTGQSINAMVGNALPHTIALGFSALFLALIFSIPLGAYSATHPGSWTDRITAVISLSFITIPSYVAGLFLLLIFAVELRWMPATGLGEKGNILDYLRHLLLPALALSITWIGYLARLIRASLLEVLNENYIRMARSTGLSERILLYKYALKNASIPTIAVLGYEIGALMGGAVFIEIIFSRPGMGTLINTAIMTRNYPVVRAGVLVVAILFILSNLVADLIYTYLDPRIQLGKERG